MLRFAREGAPFTWPSLGAAVSFWALLYIGVGAGTWWGPAVAVVSTLVAAFMFFFFRDPDREIPGDPALVLAPGDGRIVEISEVDEPAFLEGPARRISIFLSLFDVHVQRAPVGGRVAYKARKAGAYVAAWSSHASEANAHASLGLETGQGRVLVRQITGLVARRIVTRPEEGDTLGPGQRYGLIRFGSRVDTFVPLDWPVTCRVGERAIGGVTVLARMQEES